MSIADGVTAPRGLWIGTYPDEAPAGSGEGVWRVDVDAHEGRLLDPRLVAATPSPSFLALHPSGRTLYAVAEVEDGTVTTFEVTEHGGLAPRGEPVASGGTYPCHVRATEGEVQVANYGNGTFAVLTLDDDGTPVGGPLAFAGSGSGPDADRQEGPHAHFVGQVGDEVWVADLGTDELRRYRTGATVARDPLPLPPGSGPRHFVVLPGGAVVLVSELDAKVSVLVPAADGTDGTGGYDVVARHDAAVTEAPDGGRGYPSHVALSEDGRRLFVAVRGPDVLATFAVSWASDEAAGEGGAVPDGAAPVLEHLADTPVAGAWPRHFAVLSPAAPSGSGAGTSSGTSAGTGSVAEGADLVVVANQGSSNLALLRVARDSGEGRTLATLDVPVPACVLEA